MFSQDQMDAYSKAIKDCGGALALTQLDDDVKEVLKSTTDLDAKTKMLQAIADCKKS